MTLNKLDLLKKFSAGKVEIRPVLKIYSLNFHLWYENLYIYY